jgi:ribosomal protein S18 acetylase RimI-like enzyme
MSELNFRTATYQDIKQLQQLGLIAYGQFKSIISEENWQKWESGFTSDDNFLSLLNIASGFLCEAENKIVGMAFLIPSGNPYLYFQADWSYIRYVGIHPEYEGKGIGRRLTQQCIDKAIASGEKTIALHTSEFQNAARHIYESLGFTKQKDLDLVYGKQYYLYTMNIN